MGKDPGARALALARCISAVHEHFGAAQYSLEHGLRQGVPVNDALRHTVDVVVCTVKDLHVIDRLKMPAGTFEHRVTNADPRLLGYECHAVLRERLGSYDYYCFLEDDLVIHDPLLFMKLNWFNQITPREDLLQPNRFEIDFHGDVHKVYVDGDLPPRATARFQNAAERPEIKATVLGQTLTFRRTLNPHSGAFFLSEAQMRLWAEKPYFLDRSAEFIGPPESAATLGIMRTFRIYKPSLPNAAFLELQHCGSSYLSLLGNQVPLQGQTGASAAAGRKPAASAASAVPGRKPAAAPAAPTRKAATPPAARPDQPMPKNPGIDVESAVEEGLRDFGL
jgi:hypothetical protein